MPVMPSSRSRRRVEIPASQYDRLKAIADAEERTVAALAAELLGSALKSYQPLPAPTEDADLYTPRARRVLELAWKDEPDRYDHNYVGTEHLLLGLVAEGEGLGGRVLRQLGVGHSQVRQAVEFMVGKGQWPGGAPRRETPRTRKVLALAADEARKLDHGLVGTGHLLLGLVREGEGIAVGVLESLGVPLDRARASVLGAFERHDMPLSQT
jgi:ATP-dependent Clp protease ATP-binding subunit ClpC